MSTQLWDIQDYQIFDGGKKKEYSGDGVVAVATGLFYEVVDNRHLE